MNKTDPKPFEVGDRVTMVRSESLPAEMVGMKAIVKGVEETADEEYFKYYVVFRLDGKTPIRIEKDSLADEFLDHSNLKAGW